MTPKTAEYHAIPLKSLKLSDTNPRNGFDDKSLIELAASIKTHGVLQPILVRPHPKTKDAFEIISGARRYKAAILAKTGKDIPCRVKTGLSDEEVRAIQLVENLQRQDVLPLDEAEGIAELMKCKGYNLELISKQIGKDLAYVAKRLKLLELVPDAKKFLKSGLLTQDHVNLLARLTPDQQRETLKRSTREWGDLLDIIPAAKMKQDIEQEYFLDLSRAPWDKADAKLVPKAGACTNCPKMAGNSRNLFDDVKKGDTCTDPACFDQKLTAFIQVTGAEKKMQAHKILDRWGSGEEKGVLGKQDYGVVKKTECENVALGFYVTGDQIGKQVYICPKSTGCKEHWKGSKHTYDSGETAAQKEKRLAAEKERKQEIALRRALLLQVEGMAPEGLTDAEDLRLVALALWHGVTRDLQTKILKERKWMPDKKEQSFDPTEHGHAEINALAEKYPLDLSRFCIYMALSGVMDEAPTTYDFKTDKRTALPDPLLFHAAKYGIDPKSVTVPEKAPKTKKAAAK